MSMHGFTPAARRIHVWLRHTCLRIAADVMLAGMTPMNADATLYLRQAVFIRGSVDYVKLSGGNYKCNMESLVAIVGSGYELRAYALV